MSNKSPFGSSSHFACICSWKAGSHTSNPLLPKAQSRELFIGLQQSHSTTESTITVLKLSNTSWRPQLRGQTLCFSAWDKSFSAAATKCWATKGSGDCFWKGAVLKWMLRACCRVGKMGGFEWVDSVWKDSWIHFKPLVKCPDCSSQSWWVCYRRDMGCLKGKPSVHTQSTKAKYKDHSQGDAFETSSCARRRQENCMFQCRPNIMVADSNTLWVCKCLQLIYLSALPLTLFDIYKYITIYIIINCFNQTSLSWRYDYLPGAWICVNAMICKRASQVMGSGSFRGQTGWPCSKHGSQRQNCSGAVEIGIW